MPARRWYPAAIDSCPQWRLVAALAAAALAIRLYLNLTSFCIAADGMDYLRMARDFAAGRTLSGLHSRLSPLYPWLVSLASPLTGNLELAAGLISAAFGTAAVVLLYYLMREVFGRRDIAAGAAAIAAIHPGLSAYSASVRTEAGFLCLMTGALWLFASGLNRQSVARFALAGVFGGAAYLYRDEGIGLLIAGCAFLILGAAAWRQWNFAQAALWTACFAVPFILVASPFLIYLHLATGRWIVSRQLKNLMETGVNKGAWTELARSRDTSIFATLRVDPCAYLSKIGFDLWMTPYYFVQAIEPAVAVLLAIGLWVRGRAMVGNWRECWLGAVVLFYGLGFAFFNTGPRFMIHLVPYTFGWAAIGFESLSLGLARVRIWNRPVPAAAPAVLLAALLLPRTLWPIGYDTRAFAYAAADIRRGGGRPRAVAVGDCRLAYYAAAECVGVPVEPKPDSCGWLATVPQVGYLMLASREEPRWGDVRGARCLKLVKRYPRIGSSYFDLFEVKRD